jgi:diacylglycerol kinase family enzyme
MEDGVLKEGAALVLVNASAGRVQQEGAEAVSADLGAVLEARGITARMVTGSIQELLDALVSLEEAIVVTAGGDGTIGAAAGVIAKMTAPPLFVPLPFGTANLVPKDLGMPPDPVEALGACLDAPERRIDYATANGRPLLHSAVFGTFAAAADAREDMRDAQSPMETVGAAAEWVSDLVNADTARYRLVIDGEPLEAETNAVFVTNNAITGGEFGRPARERLDARELYVYVSDSRTAFGFTRRVLEFVTGGFDESHGISRHVCSWATVETVGGDLVYAVDGEVIEGEDCVRFELDPGTLRVPDLRR